MTYADSGLDSFLREWIPWPLGHDLLLLKMSGGCKKGVPQGLKPRITGYPERPKAKPLAT